MRKRSSGLVLGLAVVAALAVPAVTLSARTAEYGYVTSTLAIPTTSQQAIAYGRDINGDGKVDNGLGQFFLALESQNLDLQSDTATAIQGGQLLMLHSLQTPSFTKTKKATWQVSFAKSTSSPDFSGGGVFTVDGTASSSTRLPATIRHHHVETSLGTIPVELDLGGGIITLWLQKAVIFATCSRSGCSHGRITGAVTEQDIATKFIPVLAAQFSAIVARDCPGPGPASCVDGSTGKTLQSLFDTNGDLVITSAELSQNALIQSLLAPDVTLTHPRAKALSVGLGFKTVRAKLVR